MYKTILILFISIITFSCKHKLVNKFSRAQPIVEKETVNSYNNKTFDIKNTDEEFKKPLVETVSCRIDSTCFESSLRFAKNYTVVAIY
jgi:hypothetical protein